MKISPSISDRIGLMPLNLPDGSIVHWGAGRYWLWLAQLVVIMFFIQNLIDILSPKTVNGRCSRFMMVCVRYS